MTNWAGSAVVEVRAVVIEKWSQFPLPARNPRAMKLMMTTIFVAVSTFWTFAVRATPKQLSTAKATTSMLATACAPPRVSEKKSDPTVNEADCLRAGKKYDR